MNAVHKDRSALVQPDKARGRMERKDEVSCFSIVLVSREFESFICDPPTFWQ